MSIILPSYQYSRIYLGKINVKGLKINNENDPVIDLELKRIKSISLKEMFNDETFASRKVVAHFPVSPDGSYAVRISENVLNKINTMSSNDPKSINVLYLDLINQEDPTRFENQLIIVSASKKLDSIFVTSLNFVRTKPKVWVIFYFNRETLRSILKDELEEKGIDVDDIEYIDLEYDGATYNLHGEFYLASDARFFPKSFMRRISEEDEKQIYSQSFNIYDLSVTTSRFTIDEIHVGGLLYIKPRFNKIPYQYPFVIPFTYSKGSTIYPDDLHLNTFSLNIKVRVKLDKINDFIKNFLQYIKRSDHLLQSIQKIAMSMVFVDGIKKCKIAKYEDIIRVERNTHFLSEESRFTSIKFKHLIKIYKKFVSEGDEIKNIVDNLDVDKFVEKLTEIAVKNGRKINYNNLRTSKCMDKLKQRIVVSILELSLHGISHLIKKALISKLSLNPEDLGEYIIIKSPSVLINNLQILDGFYFYDTLTDKEIQGEVKIFVKRSYSYDTFNFFGSEDYRDVIDNIKNIIYIKNQDFRCNYNWAHEKLQLNRTYQILQNDSRTVNSVKLSDCIAQLDGYIKGVVGGHVFYPPRSMFRYLYLKKTDVEDQIKECNNNLDQNQKEAIYKELKRPLQYIWPRYVHQCFDGCYSCVMLQNRECELIEVQQEFRISKAGALFLLQI
jgi:hypothetical protein